jgi:phosphatidylserine/phosphatidylglycerophosphate/cardiolipin synthase-like enzyme
MRYHTVLLCCLLLVTTLSSCLSSATGPPPTVLISGVHPGGATDWEHVRLVNHGGGTMDISGWVLDDGEGTWTVPDGTSIGPGTHAWAATNSTAFRVLWGRDVDVTVMRSGGFGLADRGDGLVLRDPEGRSIDQVVYGDPKGDHPEGWSGPPVPTPASMPWGRLLLRAGHDDSDTAEDWADLREPRCGWGSGPFGTVPVAANASCFVTPGEGWNALSNAIASARRDLSIALYDLTSLDLVAAVARKAREGVTTRVLMEGAPVGMTDEEGNRRRAILAALAGSGAQVWVTTASEKGVSHRPYRYHHEKYCVMDGERVVVTTENWSISSFPYRSSDGYGSRGYGVVVESSGMARALLSVFDHDLRTSARMFDPGSTEPIELPALPAPGPPSPRPVACEATLLVGPEDWGPDLRGLLDIVDGAEGTIFLELAYLDIWWGGSVSPVVEALLSASSRGVEVRLVLDPGPEGEGRAALEDLHALAAQRGVSGIRGVLGRGLPDAARVHAKVAVIDGRTAIMGSLNWAWSSVARNREVVVVLEGAGVVSPLLEVIEEDWNTSVSGLAPSPPRHLLLEAAIRWGGSSFPHRSMQPFHQEERDRGSALDVPWREWLKVAVVLTLVVTARTVNRRYGLRQRASVWVERRLNRIPWAALTPAPRPSSRGGAPDASRTSGRGTARGKEAPPGPRPPRRPRVVVLPEEEARW